MRYLSNLRYPFSCQLLNSLEGFVYHQHCGFNFSQGPLGSYKFIFRFIKTFVELACFEKYHNKGFCFVDVDLNSKSRRIHKRVYYHLCQLTLFAQSLWHIFQISLPKITVVSRIFVRANKIRITKDVSTLILK